VTAGVKTSNKRVPAVTGIDRPVVIPLKTAPNVTNPVSDGAKVTVAPGTAVKVLLGVAELYNWAVTVIVEPIKVKAPATLK